MKRSSISFSILSILVLLLSACNVGKPTVAPTATPRRAAEPTQAAQPTKTPAGAEPGPEPDSYWVTNPASGARLYVQVVHPQDWDGSPLPTLVLVPGGTGDSSRFLETPSQAQRMADDGLTIVVFDPDGRGRSGGIEDDDGYAHQDGLAAIIRFVATLPEVDAARIGLVSYSYGVTMATGALARHPDLPVQFLIDWEGPANRDDTGGCDEAHLGHLKEHSCNDEAFWCEREAATFALQLPVPYQRLQSEKDHVQPDNDHALLMIANATAAEYGGHGIAPWTRLNDLTPNTVYSTADPPPMLSEQEGKHLEPLIVRYALELFDLFSASAPSDADQPTPSAPAQADILLTVDAAPSRETIRSLLGVDGGPLPADQRSNNPVLTEQYHAIGVTMIRTHDLGGPLDMATMYPDQNADPHDPASYDFEASDRVFAAIVEGGFEPYLRLGDSMGTASDFPPLAQRAPTNPDNWVQAAVEVVRHYDELSRQAGIPLRYVEIWNEPNFKQFWDATPREFYDLFANTAAALKAEFPHLMIGGPGLASSGGSLTPEGEQYTQRFLDYLQQHNTPLDFFSWHVYSSDAAIYVQLATYYRQQLDAHGYTETEIHITEWNTAMQGEDETDAVRNTARGAALMTAAWIGLQEGGVAVSTFYRGNESGQHGNMGLFYADGRAKPMALAFSLWAEMAAHPQRLAVTPTGSDDPNRLWVLAGQDERGEVALLIVNPTDTPTSWEALFAGRDLAGGATLYQVDDAGDEVQVFTLTKPAAELGAYTVQLLVAEPVFPPPTSTPAVTAPYLMALLACDTATSDCYDPSHHLVYLAQSDDGLHWSLIPNWQPYQGSVPDVIRRGDTLYIYTPGRLARYHLDTNTLDPPTPVDIADLPGGFVDPSLFIDEQGRLVLFFLYGQPGSDPAGCAPGETTCVRQIGSATEVDGSDGAAFTLDAGQRVSMTVDPQSAIKTASDPDIFFDGEQYVLYLSHGASTSVWVSDELRGAYAQATSLPQGLLTLGTGGVPAGYFDPLSGQYWTFAHINRNGLLVIRRAVHGDLSRQLGESDFVTVISGESLGLGMTYSVGSPSFAVNGVEE